MEYLIKETKQGKALWGLWRSLLANAVFGVSQGHEKKLELVGIGYRGKKIGEDLELQVGFSHPVKYIPLPGVAVNIEKNVILNLSKTNLSTGKNKKPRLRGKLVWSSLKTSAG